MPHAISGLGESLFGILTIAWVFIGSLGVLDFGLSRSATKFVSNAIDMKQINQIGPIIIASMAIALGIGVIFALVLYFWSEYIVLQFFNIPQLYTAEAIQTFKYVALGLPVILVTNVIRGSLEGLQRFGVLAASGIIVSISTYAIPAFSSITDISLPEIILWIIGFRLLAVSFNNIYLWKYYRWKKLQFGRIFLKKYLSYSGWISITNMLNPIIIFSDKFVIGYLLPVSQLTFYAVPHELVSRIRFLPTAITRAIFPLFSGTSAEQDSNRNMVFSISLLTILILISGICCLIAVNASLIIRLWLGGEYVEKSVLILQIVSCGIIFNSIALVPYNYLQGVSRPDIPSKIHASSLPVYLLLLILFTSEYGIKGTAFIWTVRTFFDMLLLLLFSFRVKPELLGSIFNKGNVLYLLIVLNIALTPLITLFNLGEVFTASLSVLLIGFLVIAAFIRYYLVHNSTIHIIRSQ